MKKQIERLDFSLIERFRFFINDQPLVYHIYHDQNGNNKWGAICSAMDWIEVAVSGIDPSLLIFSNSNESSISAMTFINCVDVLWEGIQQLHRVFVNNIKVFKDDRSVFQKTVSDNDYWKAIHAVFSAHPTNLDSITGDRTTCNKRWFASWSGAFLGSDRISVLVYSNFPGEKPEILDLDVASIMSFAQKRYEHLNNIIMRIKDNLAKHIEYFRAIPIPSLSSCKSEKVVEYVDILLSENAKRWGNSYYKERLSIIKEGILAKIKGKINLTVIRGYRKALLKELDGIRDAISSLEYDHDHFIADETPPMECLFDCQYIFDPSKRILMSNGIMRMAEYFGTLIDYDTCIGELEIKVLTRAGIWVKRQH